jgi:hypothetical protein
MSGQEMTYCALVSSALAQVCADALRFVRMTLRRLQLDARQQRACRGQFAEGDVLPGFQPQVVSSAFGCEERPGDKGVTGAVRIV